MPYDCTRLNHYIYQKNKYREAASTIESSISKVNYLLAEVEACSKLIWGKIKSTGGSSSGYLASLYFLKRGVVNGQCVVIRTHLRAGVEELSAQLQTARSEMNRYARMEARERKKKEEAEKLEAEGNNGI